MVDDDYDFVNAAITASETSDKTRKYWMYLGNERFIMNFVNERGYDTGYIQSECEEIGTARGVWSPDSVYQIGVLDKYNYFQEEPAA